MLFYTIIIRFILTLLNIKIFNCLLTINNKFLKRLILIFKTKTFKQVNKKRYYYLNLLNKVQVFRLLLLTIKIINFVFFLKYMF